MATSGIAGIHTVPAMVACTLPRGLADYLLQNSFLGSLANQIATLRFRALLNEEATEVEPVPV
jgi:hypothetical protein